MRRYDATSGEDVDDAKELRAEQWMLDCLALNPDYTSWGPHEDYMFQEGDGWQSRVLKATWAEMAGWGLDDLNEVANFYFSVERDQVPCVSCDRTGYNAETKRIADDFYDSSNAGRRWVDRITQDEVEALQEAGRLRTWTKEAGWQRVPVTAEQVNAANARGARPMHDFCHDGINRFILIETRAKRLGVWGTCAACNGKGDIYTSDVARLAITLWMLHPRKGASRGVEIASVRREELPAVFAYLRTAAERNARRFAKIPAGGL